MASDTPIHDFMLPRISALVHEAVAQGFVRDAVVAVVIDIITGPRFDTAAPKPTDDSAPHPDYQRSADVVLVDNTIVEPPRQIGARDEADFVRPLNWFS
jgi:hypothetical protein